MPVYQVGFGKVTFAASGLSLSAFDLTPPYVRKLVSKVHPVVKGTRMSEYPATALALNGKLYSQQVEIPDGAIIQVQASQTYRGARFADAVLFLRTRKGAATRSVFATVPAGEGSLLGRSFIAFSGECDELTLKELNRLGILPHPGVVKGFMDPEEVAELFSVAILAPEVDVRPEIVTLTNEAGEEVVVFTAPTPKRRIKIR